MSVGDAIRAQRQARGWSLGDVEERSARRVKASVLGAYERGERAISTRRLQLVADVLGVPVQALLGSAGPGAGTTVTVTLTIHGADQQVVMTAAAELVAAVEATGLEVVVPAAAAS